MISADIRKGEDGEPLDDGQVSISHMTCNLHIESYDIIDLDASHGLV